MIQSTLKMNPMQLLRLSALFTWIHTREFIHNILCSRAKTVKSDTLLQQGRWFGFRGDTTHSKNTSY